MSQILQIVWDPSLGIPIGSFTLRYYSLMYVIAFGLGYYIIQYIFKKEKEDLNLLDPLFMYMFIAVIAGARLGHVMFYDQGLFKTDPLAVFLPIRTNPEFEFTGFSGLASHGAGIGIVISLYLFNRKYLKRNLLWIFDRIVLPITIGGVFIRLGNFFNSEILGKPCDPSLPWSVLFVNGDITAYGPVVARHPAQLYEAVGYLLLFFSLLFIFFKTEKKKYLGWISGYFLIVLFGIRFLVEFYKEPQGEETIHWFGLNTGHWLSIPFIIVGIFMLITSKNRIYTLKK